MMGARIFIGPVGTCLLLRARGVQAVAHVDQVKHVDLAVGVDVGQPVVAHVHRPVGGCTQARQAGLERQGMGLDPTHVGRDHHVIETRGEFQPLQARADGPRVRVVGDNPQPEPACQLRQKRPQIGGRDDGPDHGVEPRPNQQGDLFGVRATWDLDSLIFNPAETQAAATAANLLKHRDELVERATHLFFKRQRLRLALMVAAPAAPQLRVEAELELSEVTSQLDALTGGLFAERSP